ncbi:MAG: hypothetical protein OXG04_30115 [Acidobacteria bacterium]|nr:hypothetical protein [Acidobacteriota bacterium]
MPDNTGSGTVRAVTDTRPGWATVIALAEHKTGPGQYNKDERRKVRPHVTSGRLMLKAENPTEYTRGILAAAAAVAAETCDACGGKGDPVAGGSRCRGCRKPDTVILARPWNPGKVEDHPDAQSPGQWTEDIRGGTTGNEWDHTNWRHYRRLETAYGTQVAALMTPLDAADDERAMFLWPGPGGWAGLLRALFLTLRSEQDERPGDDGHRPWRLRWMKEKFGHLEVRTTGQNEYQQGVVGLIEAMSGWLCIDCGKPARMRYAHWYRPQCDTCWSSADSSDKAQDAEQGPRKGNQRYEGVFYGTALNW